MNDVDKRRKLILVIDDEEAFTRLLQRNLEQLPRYRCHVANNGITGVEMVRAERPDLVLLDIMMPGLNGFETLRRIKGIDSTLPVAMVTAVYDREEGRRCFDAGAYDYVTKPVDLAHLENVVFIKLFG